jgi:hypothetical protein
MIQRWGTSPDIHRAPNLDSIRGAVTPQAALAHLGRLQDARRSIASLQTLRPGIDLAFARYYWPIADAGALEYLVDGLRKAGLTELA